MATSTSLAACLINVSEGRRHEVVWSIVRAACRAIERPPKDSEGSALQIKAVVLNTFVDKEYNRNDSTIHPVPAFLGVTFMFSCSTIPPYL